MINEFNLKKKIFNKSKFKCLCLIHKFLKIKNFFFNNILLIFFLICHLILLTFFSKEIFLFFCPMWGNFVEKVLVCLINLVNFFNCTIKKSLGE